MKIIDLILRFIIIVGGFPLAVFGYGYACYQIIISDEWWWIFPIVVVSIPMYMGAFWGIKWIFKKGWQKNVR